MVCSTPVQLVTLSETGGACGALSSRLGRRTLWQVHKATDVGSAICFLQRFRLCVLSGAVSLKL